MAPATGRNGWTALVGPPSLALGPARAQSNGFALPMEPCAAVAGAAADCCTSAEAHRLRGRACCRPLTVALALLVFVFGASHVRCTWGGHRRPHGASEADDGHTHRGLRPVAPLPPDMAWGNPQLKVLILRGEMRCRPQALCAQYWRRYVEANKVDEVYIVTHRKIGGKLVKNYRGEAWGEPRDPYYFAGPCDAKDRTVCIYDYEYTPLGVVNETELRETFGARLRAVIFLEDDAEFRARASVIAKNLEGRFPDFNPSSERHWKQHLQPNLVLERYFDTRPETKTAHFAIHRHDLLMFKVNEAVTRDHACLRLVPRPESFECMLSDGNFTMDVFTGENEVNTRSSDFIVMFDYDTFKAYGRFAADFGRYACFGNPADCKRCQLQGSETGDYRISEHQFTRWERMVVPHVRSHIGLFKYMFARVNAFTPAYGVRQPINASGVFRGESLRGVCNVDPEHRECCGVHLGLDFTPRQHDNLSTSV